MIKITASLGTSIYNGLERIDSKVLINAADNALYRAKKAGRNRLEFAVSNDYVK